MKISKKILSLFLIITFFGLLAIPDEKAVAQTVIAGKKENIKSKKALRKHSETKIRIMVVSSYHKEYLWSQETNEGVCDALLEFGYQVTSRTSSIEALEAFRGQPDEFDLVITDMTMPNMTGKALVKELMSIRSDIPIILYTGFSEQIDERRANEMGIRAFVLKPVIMREIANTIRAVLDKK